jgi:hypothetical protein
MSGHHICTYNSPYTPQGVSYENILAWQNIYKQVHSCHRDLLHAVVFTKIIEGFAEDAKN